MWEELGLQEMHSCGNASSSGNNSFKEDRGGDLVWSLVRCVGCT